MMEPSWTLMVSIPECLCLNNDAGLVAEGQPDEDGDCPVILDPVKMEVVGADLIMREQGEQEQMPMADTPDFTDPMLPFTIFTFQCPRCKSAIVIGRGTDIFMDDLDDSEGVA